VVNKARIKEIIQNMPFTLKQSRLAYSKTVMHSVPKPNHGWFSLKEKSHHTYNPSIIISITQNT
jgi:hypothetical protein